MGFLPSGGVIGGGQFVEGRSGRIRSPQSSSPEGVECAPRSRALPTNPSAAPHGLSHACCNALPQAVRARIAEGAAVNDPDLSVQGQLYTPLHWAAVNGHVQIATLLLEAGANVSATRHTPPPPPTATGAPADRIRPPQLNNVNKGMLTPLLNAAQNGQSAMVRAPQPLRRTHRQHTGDRSDGQPVLELLLQRPLTAVAPVRAGRSAAGERRGPVGCQPQPDVRAPLLRKDGRPQNLRGADRQVPQPPFPASAPCSPPSSWPRQRAGRRSGVSCTACPQAFLMRVCSAAGNSTIWTSRCRLATPRSTWRPRRATPRWLNCSTKPAPGDPLLLPPPLASTAAAPLPQRPPPPPPPPPPPTCCWLISQTSPGGPLNAQSALPAAQRGHQGQLRQVGLPAREMSPLRRASKRSQEIPRRPCGLWHGLARRSCAWS